jgi:hypothetical protein
MLEEYDTKINQIMQENNLAKLYYLLAQTFHNTLPQRELGLELLKNNLIHSFFKEALVDCHANYITFSNNEFEVSFSTSLVKEIKIRYKNATIPRKFYPSLNNVDIKLAHLIEAFLNHKSWKTFKMLADYYGGVRYKKNIIAQIFKYIDAYKECNKELLDKITQQLQREEKRKQEIEEYNIEFDQQQLYAKTFVDSLVKTDLQIFIDEGWFLKLYGIKNEKGIIRF